MALPRPAPGLVINYNYLWAAEARHGREEGVKDRPCVIVLAVQPRPDGHLTVTVAAVTHTPPREPLDAVEIPAETKRRLGLDDQRSWIVTSEVNSFIWPGPDIRPLSRHRRAEFAYGEIPRALFRRVRDQLVARAKLTITPR